MVGDPVRQQKPMQPKPFSPRFIATDHGCCLRQAKAAFGLGDFVEHTFLIPRGHGALARLLPMARSEAELSGFFTQFKGHEQGCLSCVTIRIVGRCDGHRLFPP
jgi:hypothetical protein